jgi:hypothetical protein
MDPSQPEIIASRVLGALLTVTVGGVILLRPMSKRLGDLLEAMARERQQPQVGEQLERVHDILDTIQGRLALLEERQDFTDQLLNDPERRRILSTRSRRGHDSELGGVGLDEGPVPC